MTLDEKIAQMCYEAPAIERLGVPAYDWWNECLHGVARSGPATVFPQAIGMAATFDTDAIYEVATAISDEARAKYNEYRKIGATAQYEGLTFWSPNINIFRDPRWGRGQETYGEDPYLTSIMGTAFVKGLQGDGKYRKVDATVKHFVAHSGPEATRHGFDSKMSEKDFYETYLEAFRYVIEHAHPSAVMGAYNSVNGEICCASRKLLGDILRGELGFDGYVVSDCGALADIHSAHHATYEQFESAALAVNSGCDLNCGYVYRDLGEAVEKGLVSEETITHAVELLFTARFRLGMFDDDCEYDSIPYSVVECEKHRALNRRMAQKSMVLLKNDGVLPLDRKKKIAVIGPNADTKCVLLGNYNGTPSKYSTFLRGIQDAAEGEVFYAEGSHLFREGFPSWAEDPRKDAIIAAKQADVVVLCVGLTPEIEGEQMDAYNGTFSGDKKSLAFPKPQEDLIRTITELGKPTVLVNISGSCLDLTYPKEHCGAVIQCFYPGAEGGHALADILYGEVSPSGRLPVSFYASADDLPPFDDYSMENRTYKFYKGEFVYEFGYGLTYSDIREEWTDENTVVVTNAGEYDTDYSVLKFEYIPHKNLCGVKSIHIKKGDTVTVKFD